MKIRLLFALATLLIITGCAGEKESIVREAIENKLARESNGVLTLKSFTKTNGKPQDFGSEGYILYWQIVVMPSESFSRYGDNFFGFWQDFKTDQSLPYGTRKDFEANEPITIDGSTYLEKTDNGWRVSGKVIRDRH